MRGGAEGIAPLGITLGHPVRSQLRRTVGDFVRCRKRVLAGRRLHPPYVDIPEGSARSWPPPPPPLRYRRTLDELHDVRTRELGERAASAVPPEERAPRSPRARAGYPNARHLLGDQLNRSRSRRRGRPSSAAGLFRMATLLARDRCPPSRSNFRSRLDLSVSLSPYFNAGGALFDKRTQGRGLYRDKPRKSILTIVAVAVRVASACLSTVLHPSASPKWSAAYFSPPLPRRTALHLSGPAAPHGPSGRAGKRRRQWYGAPRGWTNP